MELDYIYLGSDDAYWDDFYYKKNGYDREGYDESYCDYEKMKNFRKVLKEKNIIRYLSEYKNTINVRALLHLLNETKEYDHIFEKKEWKKINALYDLFEIEKNYERENVSF